MKKSRVVVVRCSGFGLGVASALDLGGTLSLRLRDIHKGSNNPAEIDARALAGDWANVGHDIHVAMKKYDQEKAFSAD